MLTKVQIDAIKAALKATGAEGEVLETEFQSFLNEHNEGEKNSRTSIKELKDSIETIKNNLGVKSIDEVEGKVTGQETELSSLRDTVKDLQGKFSASEAEKIEANEKANRLKISDETGSVLNKFKVKENFDHWKSSIASLSTISEDGSLLVGNDKKPIEEYVQALVDGQPAITGDKVKKKFPDGDGGEALLSEEELGAMSQAEIEENIELVDKSMAALG